MIIPFIALFFVNCFLRETKSISNIVNVLSGVSNVIDVSNKKEKETKNAIKLDVFFNIRWGSAM